MSSSQQEGEVSKDDSEFSVDLKTNKIKKRTKKKKTKKTTPKIITSTYKKQKCLHFNKGNCTKGETCTFSHDFEPQSSKIICKYFLSSACSKGASCCFSHNTQDYPCKFYHLQSRCKQLNECRFSHRPINKDYLGDFIKENKQLILTLWKQQKLYLISDQNLKREVILFISKEAAQEQPKKKGFKGELKLLAQNNIELAEETIKPKSLPVDPRLKIKLARQGVKTEETQKNQNSTFFRDWITEVPSYANQKHETNIQSKILDRSLVEKFLYSYY